MYELKLGERETERDRERGTCKRYNRNHTVYMPIYDRKSSVLWAFHMDLFLIANKSVAIHYQVLAFFGSEFSLWTERHTKIVYNSVEMRFSPKDNAERCQIVMSTKINTNHWTSMNYHGIRAHSFISKIHRNYCSDQFMDRISVIDWIQFYWLNL